MSADAAVRFHRARKHLEVFEENWKSDHHEAMDYYDFEEFLVEGVRVFQFIRDVSRIVREAIFRGLIPTNPQVGSAEKALFVDWLQTANACLPVLATFEQKFGSVSGGTRFLEMFEEAREFVKNWTPPQVAQAIGARFWDVTADEMAELRDIAQSPAGRPTREPRAVPTGDPSEVK